MEYHPFCYIFCVSEDYMVNAKNKVSKTARTRKANGNGVDGKALLEWHRLHEGIYARVARSLGVDASYVSRVASGQRVSEKIERALVSELERIHRIRP
jgi:hypothetical protein